MKITIDTDTLVQLSKEADQILFDPKAEESIVQLLQLKDQIEDAIKETQASIEAKALELNPHFKSIQSDKVRVTYREYGNKYSLDESYLDQIPQELYKATVKYSVETKEVDKMLKQTGMLPLGITTPERKKSLSLGLKHAEN